MGTPVPPNATNPVRRRAEVYADGELLFMAPHLRAFVEAVAGADGDAQLRAVHVFARVVAEAVATSFVVGHAAGVVETVRPDWMAESLWRGRRG